MAERFLIKASTLPADLAPPESSRKKVERNASLLKQKLDAVKAKKAVIKSERSALLERTKKYEKEYEIARQSIIDAKRAARAQGGFYREAEPKVIFAIRIKGINKMAPKPRKVLQLFRLKQIHNGVFIKVNDATKEMLKLIEPFIAYGYPSLKTIRELVYKRGYGKVNKQRIPLSHNEVISESLGKVGIHGVEDLVHEIYTCGPNFKAATNFLWPFKLSCPRGGYKAKRHGYLEARGGDWGNREALINKMVESMN